MPLNNVTTLEAETETTNIVKDTVAQAPAQAAPQSVATIESTSDQNETDVAAFDASEGELSLQHIKETLRAIAFNEVRRLHVTSPSLISVGLVYAANFAEDRYLFDSAFKKDGFDVTAFDDMRERAMAYWHLCISVRQDADAPIKLLLAEAKPLRTKLVRAATYLWGEDAKLGDIVAGIRNGNAYLNQADDLGALAKLFVDNWKSAEGRCDVTKTDLQNAGVLGGKFLERLGRMKAVEITELKELRLKAGEYLLRGIESIRDAAAFVFGPGDDRLSRYPSLSVMKRRKAGINNDDVEQINGEEVVETETDDISEPPQLSDAPTAVPPVAVDQSTAN